MYYTIHPENFPSSVQSSKESTPKRSIVVNFVLIVQTRSTFRYLCQPSVKDNHTLMPRERFTAFRARKGFPALAEKECTRSRRSAHSVKVGTASIVCAQRNPSTTEASVQLAPWNVRGKRGDKRALLHAINNAKVDVRLWKAACLWFKSECAKTHSHSR